MECILIKRTPLSYFLNVHNANDEGNLWKKNKEPKVKQPKKSTVLYQLTFLPRRNAIMITNAHSPHLLKKIKRAKQDIKGVHEVLVIQKRISLYYLSSNTEIKID